MLIKCSHLVVLVKKITFPYEAIHILVDQIVKEVDNSETKTK